jgi:hypothetical protein
MMKSAIVVASLVAMATCEIEHFVAVMFENRAMDHVVSCVLLLLLLLLFFFFFFFFFFFC